MREVSEIQVPDRLFITVVVAHPDQTTRTALATESHRDGEVEVVAQLGSGGAVFEMVRDLAPDVVLLSTDLAGCDAIDVCRQLSEDLPVCRVVLISTGDDPPYVAVAAGAAGAVTTSDVASEVAHVVRHTARGEAFIPPGWAAGLLDEYAALPEGLNPGQVAVPRSTATEREVLRRLANGMTPEAVAKLHEVPPRLVRLNAGLAMAKLQRMHRDQREIAARD